MVPVGSRRLGRWLRGLMLGASSFPAPTTCLLSLMLRPQAGARPPSFVFFVNDEKLFPDDYRRYMERQLRDNIGERGAGLRQAWRCEPCFGGGNERTCGLC